MVFNPRLKIAGLPGAGGTLTEREKERGSCRKPTENSMLEYPGITDSVLHSNVCSSLVTYLEF